MQESGKSVFEPHAVPQNVTNFEFHLVGDMTLKQFTYLATGCGVAFVLFATLAKSYPFIIWPIIVISALTGAAFAFLPIMERPLDHWVKAFFIAIFKPTQLQYSSKAIKKEDPIYNNRLNLYLSHTAITPQMNPAPITPPVIKTVPTIASIPNQSPVVTPPPPAMQKPTQTVPQPVTQAAPRPQPVIPTPPVTQPAVHHDNPIESLLSGLHLTPTPQPAKEAQKLENSLPSAEQLKKTVELAKEAQSIQTKILETEKQLDNIKAEAAHPGVDSKDYIDKFQKVMADLQKLNAQAEEISRNLAQHAKVTTPVSAASKPAAPTVAVKPIISPNMTLTSIPNIINGIITDSMGNYLDGAIIVAHDKQGLPVRALKSNKLGQFIAATPLGNGKYNITVEKEALVFDPVEIELKGDLLKPIVVSAKKQG